MTIYLKKIFIKGPIFFSFIFFLLTNTRIDAYQVGKTSSSGIHLVYIILIAILLVSLVFLFYKNKKLKAAHVELSLEESVFKEIYEKTLVALYRITPDGKIIYANNYLAKLFGFDKTDELINLNMNDFLQKSELDYNRNIFIRKIESEGFITELKSSFRNKNGELLYISETARKIVGKNGESIYYDGIINDITQLKNDEDVLKRYIEELTLNKDLVEQNAKEFAELSEKLAESEEQLKEINRSKDKFFSIISHDLRSPFNSLIGFSDLLVKNFDDFKPDEIKSISQNINQSIKNLFKLIENLLHWSGLQTGKMRHNPTILNLNSIVAHIFDLLAGNAIKKEISIINETNSDIYIYADEFMVNSIIQNLISNAIKFTRAGGSVKISSKIIDEYVEVTIMDTGVGINQESIDKLFRIDSNLSTKGTSGEPGTGLGLILCKELVEKNGGRIKVQSQVGKGTSFVFTFPYVADVENFQTHKMNMSSL